MEPAIYTAKSHVPGRTVVLFSNLSRTIRFSLNALLPSVMAHPKSVPSDAKAERITLKSNQTNETSFICLFSH